jgi:hypothetical protein
MSAATERLVRGQIFLYRGPNRWWVRRTSAPGQIIGVETSLNVIHVATLFEVGSYLEIEVGHLPITLSSFHASILSVVGEKDVVECDRDGIQTWRRRHALGEVGAFSLPLWKAERHAWQVVREGEATANREAMLIDYAFPLRSSDGTFTGVEVGVRARVTEKLSDEETQQASRGEPLP